MKKKVFFVILFILFFTIIIFYFIDNKPININKKMLSEENYMESAWDFNQNLNIGWNLGMSLSANIQYPEVITYNVIVNNQNFKDFKSKESNTFLIENGIVNNFKIEFNIPYSNLDGILYWTLDELSIDNNIIYCDKSYETEVICGKALVELENINIIGYHEIKIKIAIKKFYEYNTKNKVDFYETFWCETKTDKELIQTLKNKGFNAIRISFDVSNHLNNEGIIDSLWLDRLK